MRKCIFHPLRYLTLTFVRLNSPSGIRRKFTPGTYSASHKSYELGEGGRAFNYLIFLSKMVLIKPH